MRPASHHPAVTKPPKPTKPVVATERPVDRSYRKHCDNDHRRGQERRKDVKGRTISIFTPTTSRILVNGARKAIADLGVDPITVTGTCTGSL